MKRLFLLLLLVLGALDLAALRTGDKAVELPRLKFINGVQTPLALPLKQNVLRVVTFVLTRARGAEGTVGMLAAIDRGYRGKVRQIVVTPDPESDALSLKDVLRNSGVAFALDSSRRITMQYMAGSLLYPKSFVIDPDGVIIWCGETVDLGEMLQEYFAGTFDRKAEEKIAPMLEELQTLLRETSEPKMRALSNKIFALSPAHPGALRIRLFALENSSRIPQAWELLEERLKAAPRTGRLYFTAIDFISRYAYFRPRLAGVLKNFSAQVKDPGARCAMAWELLRRFQYDLTALESACRLLGDTPPPGGELRLLWYAAKARTAYLTGDLDGAVKFQKSASRPGQGKDPMLEYFEGAAKLGAKRP
ncbi:MAG: hypothetical protein IJT50_11885 [Lentisphaeria bacterium]|nr:hypothetical protein [Lentisphaeria bacterium]